MLCVVPPILNDLICNLDSNHRRQVNNVIKISFYVGIGPKNGIFWDNSIPVDTKSHMIVFGP